MDVLVKDLTSVSLVTQNWVRVVRRTETQCVCLSQNTVTVRSGGCAGEQVNLELIACCVSRLCLFSNSGWQGLWVASAGKAGDAYAVTMVDKLGCLFSRHDQVLVIANPVRQIDYLLVVAHY